MHGHLVAFLFVLLNEEIEEDIHSQRLKREPDIERILGVGDAVKAIEFGLQRHHALLLRFSFVHRRRPEIADFLFIRSGRCFLLSGCFVNCAELNVKLFANKIADTPCGFRGRNGILPDPASIRITEEVVAGIDGGVHVGDQEVLFWLGRLDRLLLRPRLAGSEQQAYKDKRFSKRHRRQG